MIRFLIRKIFFRNLVSPLTEIELTQNGFSIRKPFGAKPKIYHWNKINNIRFSENYKEIIIENRSKQIVLKNNNIGWYELIQNVPTKFIEFDFDYAKSFMDSLKSCGVCGIVAVRQNECIVCKTIAWNSEMSESLPEYLKLKQSDFYSCHFEEGIEIKKIAEPEHGFKADKDWKLYI